MKIPSYRERRRKLANWNSTRARATRRLGKKLLEPHKRGSKNLGFAKLTRKLAVSMLHLPPTSAASYHPPNLPTTSFLQRSPVVVGRPWPGRTVTAERRDQSRIYGELRALPQSETTSRRRASRLLNSTRSMSWTWRFVWKRGPLLTAHLAAATSKGKPLLPNTPPGHT